MRQSVGDQVSGAPVWSQMSRIDHCVTVV